MAVDMRLQRYAELAVRVGANVEAGQIVTVGALVEHTEFARAIARAAYEAGAKYVEVSYRDQHVRRAMIELGPEETLTWSPPWMIDRMEELGSGHAAMIALSGDPEPDLLSDLDPERVGRARPLKLAEVGVKHTMQCSNNWTIVAVPNEGWAEKVFGEPDVERLWDAVAFSVRLDEDDPPAAWLAHRKRLEERAKQLNGHGFDAVRFRGPGTDLTVGLDSATVDRGVSAGIPRPATAFTAARRGDTVEISWTAPTLTTDGENIKGPVRVLLCAWPSADPRFTPVPDAPCARALPAGVVDPRCELGRVVAQAVRLEASEGSEIAGRVRGVTCATA